jgi:cytochrome b561
MHDGYADAQRRRYALPQRLLHWLVAVLVLGSLTTGLALGALGFEGAMQQLGRAGTNLLYTSHKSIGIAVLGCMLLRLIARLAYGKPGYARPLPIWQQLASSVVHGGLYLLLIAMPVLGWLATGAGGFPVQFLEFRLPPLIVRDDALSAQLFLWHAWLGWALLGLIGVHVLAALQHWLLRGDEVMGRISLRRPREYGA